MGGQPQAPKLDGCLASLSATRRDPLKSPDLYAFSPKRKNDLCAVRLSTYDEAPAKPASSSVSCVSSSRGLDPMIPAMIYQPYVRSKIKVGH